MFFKKEQVEQAKRMKIKLRTESSFERPETNSGTGHFDSEYFFDTGGYLVILRHGDPIKTSDTVSDVPRVIL